MFQVTICCHGTPALEIRNACPELHAFLRSMVRCNWMPDPRYAIRQAAGAFLQGGHDREEGWILIEFWRRPGAQAFVDYVNAHAPLEAQYAHIIAENTRFVRLGDEDYPRQTAAQFVLDRGQDEAETVLMHEPLQQRDLLWHIRSYGIPTTQQKMAAAAEATRQARAA